MRGSFSLAFRLSISHYLPPLLFCRHLASQSAPPKGAGIDVFDRNAKRLQRNWAASLDNFRTFQYLKNEVGYCVADRVFDIKKQFDVGVDLGCGLGHIAPHLFHENVRYLMQVDISEGMLAKAKEPRSEQEGAEPIIRDCLNSDEELVTLRENSIDLVVSSMSAHWINDLPQFFRRIFNILTPDGAFLCAMMGQDTLFELRCSLQLAEQERYGGISAHLSPFTQPTDINALMNRAGFQLITIDCDEIEICYPDMISLLHDLQAMAENGAAHKRCLHLKRDILKAAEAIYKERYSKKRQNVEGKEEEGEETVLPATFSIIYMIGWKPGPTMKGPAKRGSATVSLKDIDKLTGKS